MISIHALLAESDLLLQGFVKQIFHFYPRSPCGERHWPRVMVSPTLYFYPRSPCGERLIFAARHMAVRIFLSTLSLRRATHRHIWCLPHWAISIHALLAESDKPPLIVSAKPPYFYPRSPCGERPHIRSTSHGRPDISIHALLAESDVNKIPD